MKKDMAEKGLYIGTGIGIILFALVGIYTGSLIGGAIGLMISNALFSGEGISLLPRIITAASMVAGILGSGFVFIVGNSVLGWAAGFVVDAVTAREVEATKVTSS